MSLDVRLRVAVIEDAFAIATIHVAARRHSLPYLPELHSDEEARSWISDVVLPNQNVWVATLDGVVVGYIAMHGTELNDLYVAPHVHGQGIGTMLLRKAKDLGAGTLRLWTFQRNERARAFYEQHGFRAIELTDGSNNEEREPDIRYEWLSWDERIDD